MRASLPAITIIRRQGCLHSTSAIQAHLASTGKPPRRMIQHVGYSAIVDIYVPHRHKTAHRIVNKPSVISQILVARIDHENLVEHHLTRSPHRILDFERVARVLILYLDKRQIVLHTSGRHIQIQHLGRKSHRYRKSKYLFSSHRDVSVLHRRHANYRRRIHSVLPVRDARDVEFRIIIRQRIESSVVAKRPFQHQFFLRVHIALNHKIGVLRHVNLGLREAFDQIDSLAAQKTGEQILVDAVGKRSRGAIRIHRVAAKYNRTRHPASEFFILLIMTRPGLVQVPMHRSSLAVKQLYAIHTDIADARLGVYGIHHRQCNKPAAVVWPAFHYRQTKNVDFLVHHLLAHSPTLSLLRKTPADVFQ